MVVTASQYAVPKFSSQCAECLKSGLDCYIGNNTVSTGVQFLM